MVGFALSFAFLGTAATPAAVWVSSILMGVSNGLTSGFLQVCMGSGLDCVGWAIADSVAFPLQVLGADLAPEGARSQFIGMCKPRTCLEPPPPPLPV